MRKIWYNGTIYTMEQKEETVEAVLTENGKIIATDDYETLATSADIFIDLKGATMYPGFVDSHLHMMHIGNKLAMLDLSHVTSKNDMLQMIQNASENLSDDAWLFADGWNENNFDEPIIPTIEELDQIRKGPMQLTRICHHVSLHNSSALAFAGITGDTADPVGGQIGKTKDDALDGLLYDQAMDIISDLFSKEGQAYRDGLDVMLENAIHALLTVGLTGGHTEDMSYYGPYTNPLDAFHRTIGKRKHFRAHLLRHHTVFEAMQQDQAMYDASFIEPGPMKIFADGAFGGSTAALSEPYADDTHNQGLLIHTNKDMEKWVTLARRYNEAVAIHVIGDAAVEQVLQIIEKHPAPSNKRDRLIHASLLREELIDRMAALPLIVDAQPAFVPSDFPWLTTRIGEERAKLAYPWRTLLDQGIICAFGTDAPIESINPLETIYAAVTRKSSEGVEAYFPEQNISRFEAIQMYTIGSAIAANQEDRRGYIKQGYDADFSIFDRDLLAGTAEDMLQAEAVKTVVAGNIVYDADL